MITIYYPLADETSEVFSKASNIGKLLVSPEGQDTREVFTHLNRSDIESFEEFLVERGIAYDLIQHSSGIEAPKMKKVRPEADFAKEISCVLYQSDENVEEGVVAVSTLISLLDASDETMLREKLMSEIRRHSFAEDEIDDIFAM